MADMLLAGAAWKDIPPKINARIYGHSSTQYSESIRDQLRATDLAEKRRC